jgi:hypothetical protein
VRVIAELPNGVLVVCVGPNEDVTAASTDALVGVANVTAPTDLVTAIAAMFDVPTPEPREPPRVWPRPAADRRPARGHRPAFTSRGSYRGPR